MRRRPPRSTRTDTLVPDTTHCRSLACEAGRKDPTQRDAVWELPLEAGDTLGRWPNRERGWLTGASRAHWPAFASVLTGETNLRPSPPSGAAIDRLDSVGRKSGVSGTGV